MLFVVSILSYNRSENLHCVVVTCTRYRITCPVPYHVSCTVSRVLYRIMCPVSYHVNNSTSMSSDGECPPCPQSRDLKHKSANVKPSTCSTPQITCFTPINVSYLSEVKDGRAKQLSLFDEFMIRIIEYLS